MAVVFSSTLKTIVKGGAAVFNGNPEQCEYLSFRESLTKGCLYLFGFIYALTTIIRIAVPIHKLPIKYTWAELLINYQGGFVRRGLLGEVLFLLQPVIPSAAAACILIFFSYCLFTYLVLKLVSDAPLVVFSFFVFSPAAFLFPIRDPAVFGRKEIFFFLAFALTVVICKKYSDYRVKAASFLVLYTIAALIHEAAVFFAPLAACIVVFSMRECEGRLRLRTICCLLFYVFLLCCILYFSVNPNFDPAGIIRSWSPYYPNIDTGSALNFLNKGLDITAITRQKAASFNQFSGPYLVDFCLALLPIFLLLMHTDHLKFFRILKNNDPILFALTITSVLSPFVLFCFLLDWGRGIYFFSMHVFIFLVALTSFGLVKYRPVPPVSKYQWKIYTVFFLYYALLWKMPHMR